jgi:hypothetical protein
VIEAPSVAIRPCLAKLVLIRASKFGSLGSGALTYCSSLCSAPVRADLAHACGLSPGIRSRRPRRPQLLAPEMAVLMVLKVVVSCVPTAVIAPMITTEMSAAMAHIRWRLRRFHLRGTSGKSVSW